MAKKTSIMLGRDGLPADDVATYPATSEHLQTFEQASQDMARWKAPALFNPKDPHSYLLVGLLDGTGNDVNSDPVHATNVANFREQLRELKKTSIGSRVRAEYLEGPGTQGDYIPNRIDAATGQTSLQRAETMYLQLVEQAQEIYRQDPQAKIAIHLEGFSRGASQVPLLARIIDERGIPDPKATVIGRSETGLPIYDKYQQPPGRMPMSVGLYDPVPTGYMELLDRRLPPSVVSGFQITSIHERRGLFKSDVIIPEGLSEDGRFLNVRVAGAHSDVGGSYLRNGLSVRSFNLMTDYHNHILGEPVLQRLHEPTDPRMNVIHRSELGSPLYRVAGKVDRATPDGQIRELTPDTSRVVRPGELAHTPAVLPEALRVELQRMVNEGKPVQRTPLGLVSDPALTEGDTLAARIQRTAEVEFRPYQPPVLERPAVRIGGALGAAGVAAAVADAVHTGHRFETMLAQDNLLGARHELRDYAANNANAWVAAYTVGKLGAELGGRRGVQGAIAGGVAGGIVGYVMSDKAMAGVDAREITKQVDAQARHWEFNGNQWVRPMEADLSSSGTGQIQEVNFSADLDTRRELDYKATNTSVEIGMRRLSPPRNPYSLEASDQDGGSLRPANWTRDPGTGQWQRDRITNIDPSGRNIHDFQIASPERAAELDQQAAKVIEANIANGPAPIAARYQIAHQLNGWEGPEPAAVSAALNPDSLQASDGNQYRRGIDGQWRHGDEVAQGNLAAELTASREALQPKLQSHTQTIAQLPQWQRPTQVQEDLASLANTYRGFGVAPNPETLAAVQLAINNTREQHGIDPATASLALDPNAQGKRDINSPIMHLQAGNDGAVRVVAMTTALDIETARQELRRQGLSLDAPVPNAPEQPEQVERPSQEQRAVQAQAVAEAQRLGATPEQVQQVASQVVDDRQQAVEQRTEVSRAYAGPSMGGAARSIDRDEQQEPTPRQKQAQGFPTDHHDYALFVAIQQQLPKDTPDEKTAEIMHQAKLGGIKRPDQLDEVVVENDRALVFGKTAGSYSQEVSLDAQAPSLNETLQRNQDFDQQQALQLQQFQEQQARINQNQGGPTMTM